MTWMRDKVAHVPAKADLDTLLQYVRCYLMMLIGGFLFTNKSAILVLLRWLPLLENFHRYSQLSWESALLCHTYHLLCTAAGRDVTDIARLGGLGQQGRDHHDGRIQSLHRRINALTFDQLRQIASDWLMSDTEIMEGCHPSRLLSLYRVSSC
ncbi:hypothetical protein HN51_003177 [Arachis hypogaea]